mmetsp:Transcript_52390/g.150161  ORF Transcript_52390/g.150161 Transcript_52390/m.150161 type:complete len:244 (+) Transcript_52390:189-920(+)
MDRAVKGKGVISPIMPTTVSAFGRIVGPARLVALSGGARRVRGARGRVRRGGALHGRHGIGQGAGPTVAMAVVRVGPEEGHPQLRGGGHGQRAKLVYELPATPFPNALLAATPNRPRDDQGFAVIHPQPPPKGRSCNSPECARSSLKQRVNRGVGVLRPSRLRRHRVPHPSERPRQKHGGPSQKHQGLNQRRPWLRCNGRRRPSASSLLAGHATRKGLAPKWAHGEGSRRRERGCEDLWALST